MIATGFINLAKFKQIYDNVLKPALDRYVGDYPPEIIDQQETITKAIVLGVPSM